MSAPQRIRHVCTCDIKPPFGPVFAGASFEAQLTLACEEQCDLAGETIQALAADGTELARALIAARINPETREFVAFVCDISLPSPVQPGSATYRFAMETAADAEAEHTLGDCSLEIVAGAHQVKLLCWDEPATVNAGEMFRFRAGALCLAGCNMARHTIRVLDDTGAVVQTLALSDDVWPGTTGVHHAEVVAPVGEQPCQRTWSLSVDEAPGELPHHMSPLQVSCRVLSSPECEIVVQVVDSERKTPIAGARLVAHPYRTLTDENGVAKLKVSRGNYELLVSARRYGALARTVEITGDYATQAEMISDEP